MGTSMEKSIAQATESNTSHSPITLRIDWNHLHAICDGDEEFELELLRTFAEDTQLHLAEMETAIAVQDFDQLEQQAHYIKGASANIGLMTVQATAIELEYQAHQKQLSDAFQLLSKIQHSLKEVQFFLTSKGLR
ncbi:MAG: Hpt domain-containing protein [Leptolyngbyaceae cyanobacterium RU_5_1]|nr:Hpt domain-containing protein [Leptolyngbyaceae cyanobacterium RU_5_1]